MNILPYNFTIKSFVYNDVAYKVALTPELCNTEDALDCTGNYCVIMISELNGTSMFELNIDIHKKWETNPKGISPGIIDKLNEIIIELRNN